MTDSEMSSKTNMSEIDHSWNFKFLALDVILYNFALAFIDQSTVLPAFLSKLTNSMIIIGAITAIRLAGTLIPQLWTAHYLRNKIYIKGFLIRIALISRLATAFLAVVLYLTNANSKSIILVCFLIMYTAFWGSEGYASVPWLDLVAKSVNERMRGRLFGLTQICGGILAVIAGLIISMVLSNKYFIIGYPTNYAILITISAVFFALSLYSITKVNEPAGMPEPHDDLFIMYLKRMGSLIAENSQLKQFIAVQLLLGVFAMALPFYILYVSKIGGLNSGEVGILLAVQTIGNIAASGIAGNTSDNYGPKFVIIGTAVFIILAQVIVFTITKPSIIVYGILFLFIGAIIGSTTIGLTNYLLELAHENHRKSYIGLMNTANAPTMLFPIIGGVLIQSFTYKLVFGLAGIAGIISLIIALKLQSRSYGV